MKKKLYLNFIFILLVSICLYLNSGYNLADYTKCGGISVPTGLLTISSMFFKLLQFVVPICLIFYGMLDLVKAVSGKNQDVISKKQKLFIKRLVVGASAFFVLTIVQTIVGIIEETSDYTSCLACAFKGEEHCGGTADRPYEIEYPEQITIYDPDVGFVQPKLRDDAYKDNNNSNNGNNNSPATGTAKDLVEYAKKHVGTPYVWGGSNLSSGVDCSGFTMAVFSHFGVELPHYAHDQSKMGTTVNGLSNAQPGDLLFFDWGGDGNYDHVAIYLGDNQKIHASGDQSCRGKTADGCQVKIDSNSMNNVKLIKRVKV